MILKLRVSDKIVDKVIWLLKQFKKDELEIIEENDSSANASELKAALARVEKGEALYYTVEEADSVFENTIRKNEGKTR